MEMGAEAEEGILGCEEAIEARQVLVHFDDQLPLILACDASPYGLESVLP